ncbi:hypothetical protein Bhyg_10979 [Pseudolycoriella hygida]|uniref:Uncharacterized protein n=1 Tax=Pseudolycoriella hygida TaxID=35572 RepID=A0A9Q0MUF9_9DIPT|nr:hypothetical protein Bhyg_10979 [Pseudolycoriella hygida]
MSCNNSDGMVICLKTIWFG